MLCVPVTNSEGKTIAVVQAINKLDTGTASIQRRTSSKARLERHASRIKREGVGQVGFNHNDLRTLQSLCSHIAVALERLDGSDEDEGKDLKETIRLLKNGGTQAGQEAPFGFRERRPLHKD
jgi:hypothetical protein